MRPANLYELCEQVCETIELAPMNYYQENWAVSAKEMRRRRSIGSDGPTTRQENTCGTVFCRAGHMIAILDADEKRTPEEWDALNVGSHVADRATNLLMNAGIPAIEVERLFGGGACPGEWGEEKHAKAGIKGMKEFMAKHEAKLKAAKVPPQ